MLGLIIAVAVFLWYVIMSGATGEAAYLASTGFLFNWYWITSIITLSIIGIISLVLTFGGAAGGSGLSNSGIGKLVGGLSGGAAGGVAGLLLLAFGAVKCGLFVGGAWLLNNALADGMTFDEGNKMYMVAGGVILLIGIISQRSSSSSSSSDD